MLFRSSTTAIKLLLKPSGEKTGSTVFTGGPGEQIPTSVGNIIAVLPLMKNPPEDLLRPGI